MSSRVETWSSGMPSNRVAIVRRRRDPTLPTRLPQRVSDRGDCVGRSNATRGRGCPREQGFIRRSTRGGRETGMAHVKTARGSILRTPGDGNSPEREIVFVIKRDGILGVEILGSRYPRRSDFRSLFGHIAYRLSYREKNICLAAVVWKRMGVFVIAIAIKTCKTTGILRCFNLRKGPGNDLVCKNANDISVAIGGARG